MIHALTQLSQQNACKPRASGDDPNLVMMKEIIRGVNPARAGMILTPGPIGPGVIRKPRASGDDPRNSKRRRDHRL